MNSVFKKTEIYSVEIQDTTYEFKLQTELNKLEKDVLLEITNPNYAEIQHSYQHLRDIAINDNDPKEILPVHVILGVGDYAKVKTHERARIGQPGEPIAELTKLGWVLTSPGQEETSTNMLFSKTSIHDYENLCTLDVLGIEDNHCKHNDMVHEDFIFQIL